MSSTFITLFPFIQLHIPQKTKTHGSRVHYFRLPGQKEQYAHSFLSPLLHTHGLSIYSPSPPISTNRTFLFPSLHVFLSPCGVISLQQKIAHFTQGERYAIALCHHTLTPSLTIPPSPSSSLSSSSLFSYSLRARTLSSIHAITEHFFSRSLSLSLLWVCAPFAYLECSFSNFSAHKIK